MSRPDFYSEAGIDRRIKGGRGQGSATPLKRCKHYPLPPPGLAGIRPPAQEHSRAATPPGLVSSIAEIDTTIFDIQFDPLGGPGPDRVYLLLQFDKFTHAIVGIQLGGKTQ